ncbi:guanylate-binding protein 6-like isoform X2 [Aquarana catesbeiana]|uniref:guanylate-binding protein 6-like isoform X2 n=1 Tax=Aquarana catesbeiana TaxID=8400 RepID=UPI003CCA1EFF
MKRTVRDALVNALENLESNSFKKFKGKLSDVKVDEKYSVIPRSRLENANVGQIVDLILDYYKDSYGGNITLEVLHHINERKVEEKLRKDLGKDNSPSLTVGSVITMEAPIRLIEHTENDKLVVNQKAINILSKSNQPVVVVAIVGMYRTGKSYLMNKLAGAQSGFDVGSTVQAQTKGIWMWCVPHPIKANHTLVLLDTEGLGDVEKGDCKGNIKVFSLAILLSSALIYNSKGIIDQDAIDKLRFVGEISEFIKIKSEDNEDEEEEFSNHFPIFIWAVRDFHLELTLDGQPISEDEYLENALKLNPEKTTKDKDYNRLRKRIQMYFKTRKCFTFGFPATDFEGLKNLEKASALSENFVAQCQKFCNYIFQQVGAKSVGDMLAVTGHQLGELTKIYIEAITNSRFACMEKAVGSLVEQETRAAIEEATKYYVDKMKTIQLPTETLNGLLEQSKKYEDEACQMFQKRSIKSKNSTSYQEFMENVRKERNGFISINEEKSREMCNSLIKKLSLTFEKALDGGVYNIRGGHEKFKQDLKAIEEKYKMERGKGVKAEEALQQYIISKQRAEIIIIQQDNALTLKEKEVAEENNRRRIHEMEQNFRRQSEEQKRQRDAEHRASLQQTINEMTKHMQEERRMMNEKARQQELYLKQGFQEQAKMYQALIDKLQRELQEKKEAERLQREREEKTQQLLNMLNEQNKALLQQIQNINKNICVIL